MNYYYEFETESYRNHSGVEEYSFVRCVIDLREVCGFWGQSNFELHNGSTLPNVTILDIKGGEVMYLFISYKAFKHLYESVMEVKAQFIKYDLEIIPKKEEL